MTEFPPSAPERGVPWAHMISLLIMAIGLALLWVGLYAIGALVAIGGMVGGVWASVMGFRQLRAEHERWWTQFSAWARNRPPRRGQEERDG